MDRTSIMQGGGSYGSISTRYFNQQYLFPVSCLVASQSVTFLSTITCKLLKIAFDREVDQ